MGAPRRRLQLLPWEGPPWAPGPRSPTRRGPGSAGRLGGPEARRPAEPDSSLGQQHGDRRLQEAADAAERGHQPVGAEAGVGAGHARQDVGLAGRGGGERVAAGGAEGRTWPPGEGPWPARGRGPRAAGHWPLAVASRSWLTPPQAGPRKGRQRGSRPWGLWGGAQTRGHLGVVPPGPRPPSGVTAASVEGRAPRGPWPYARGRSPRQVGR